MNWLKHFSAGALLVVATLYVGPLSGTVSYALSTHDISPVWMWLFHPLLAWALVLPGILLFVAAPAVFLLSWKRSELRRFRLHALTIWLVNWGVFFQLFAASAGWPQRRTGLMNTSVRAYPLIVAIENYHFDNGRPPTSLSELVPGYIAAIPATGMTAYPEFRYASNANRTEGAKFYTYELSVQTTFGLGFDSFNYWPEGNYPARMYGGRVERVGTWAYVHE